MRAVLAVLAIVLTVACAWPLSVINANSETAIPDEYIVVLQKNATTLIRDKHVASVIKRMSAKHERIMHVYQIGDFIGYAAVLTPETLKGELEHPNVLMVEANQVVSINEDYATQNPTLSWGVDRIDQTALPLNNQFRYFVSAGGASVTAYVIDTGILTTHTQFEGRAKFGYSSVTGEATDDLNGHGTHVAGTIGGVGYGVAKKVTLVAVKVLGGNGSGTIAGVIAGVDWVTKDHTDRGRDARSVANMSLGGGAAPTLDTAVTNSIAAGVSYAIAGGNNNGASACNYSPARVATAVTVGATANTDARASFSNIGTCTTIFAPGQNIVSSYIGSNTATATLSGTSMAAPHVAGVIALRLGNTAAEGNPVPETPATIKAWLQAVGTPNVVTNPGTGSPNLLLYSPFITPTAL